MFFSFAFPKAKVLLFFVLPLPAIVAAFLFIGIDLWGLFQQVGANGGWPIGHGAHLGGAVVGILYYLVRGRAICERSRGELPT
jgi:membrane associated rhomboid family serine protease